jgi:DNA-binding transcriptional MerR regulator
MNTFAIGALSRATGVKVPTIRYYESIGLMPEGARTLSNRRTYGDAEIGRLNFIRHARELGFSIDDIRALLELAAAPQQSCHLADSIAWRNIAAIDQRIAALQGLRAELQRMVDECAHGRAADCRVIGVIADHSACLHPGHDPA